MMLLAIAAILAAWLLAVWNQARRALRAETLEAATTLWRRGHQMEEWHRDGGPVSTCRALCVQCDKAATVNVTFAGLFALIRTEIDDLAPQCPGPVQVTR